MALTYFRAGVLSGVPEAINSIILAFALCVAFPSSGELVRISLQKGVGGVDIGGGIVVALVLESE